MSGDELRRAAEQARVEAETHRGIAPHLTKLYGDDQGAEGAASRHLAVADWLEETAERLDDDVARHFGGPRVPQFDTAHAWTERNYRASLAVARAYLGGSS